MNRKAFKELLHSLYLQVFLGIGVLFTQCVVVDRTDNMFFRGMGGGVLIAVAFNSLIYATRLCSASRFSEE